MKMLTLSRKCSRMQIKLMASRMVFWHFLIANLFLMFISLLNRGYYTVARRYEVYVRVARILFLPREHEIHIFESTYNVLFIIWRLNKRDAKNQFSKSKRGESWRHWTIRHSQRWHTENTPLGSRMKWRMEFTTGLVPSKTLSSI